MLCVLYALMGIPLNALLIGSLGAEFSTKVGNGHPVTSASFYFRSNLCFFHNSYVFYSQVSRLKERMWQSLGKGRVEARPRVVGLLLLPLLLLLLPQAGVIIAETGVFVMFFFCVFHPLPAAMFTHFENGGHSFWQGEWSFLDSLYYTFVTLTTIGFGDMVPGGQGDGAGTRRRNRRRKEGEEGIY